MRNSIIADMIRIQKKKSFWIMMSVEVLIVILTAVVVFVAPMEMGKDEAFKMYLPSSAAMATLFVGIPIFLAVYSDDFKSRAMQTAIGFGLSRSKLIVARYIEAFLLIVETLACIIFTMFILGLIGGVSMGAIGDVALESVQDLVPTMCYFSICVIIVYASQSATFALVLYILFTLNVLGMALGGISAVVPFLKANSIHLEYILPENMLSDLARNPEFNYGWAIWIVVIGVYLLLPIWLATRLFKNKELEF